MPSYVTPKKNTQFIFYIGLRSRADTKVLQANPTIAAGDFKVSTDGGSLGNLGTLPAVTPASSKMVKITLSTSEMNGDNVTVVCSDAAGDEWCDEIINIQTSASQVDDAVNINTPIKKNTALSNYEFVMQDASGNAVLGATVIAQRSIDGAAFAACTNSPTEVSNGVYKINLAAADLNGNTVMLRFSATAAKDTLHELFPLP